MIAFHIIVYKSFSGQPASSKRKKAKKLGPVRGFHHNRSSRRSQSGDENGIISVPDGQGNQAPEYVALRSSNSNVRAEPSIDPQP